MKVHLTHSITHDGKEYGRGVHDLDQAMAECFLLTAPHAATRFAERAPSEGKVSKAPDSDAGAKLNAEAKALFADGATIAEVAATLNISKTAAQKLRKNLAESEGDEGDDDHDQD